MFSPLLSRTNWLFWEVYFLTFCWIYSSLSFEEWGAPELPWHCQKKWIDKSNSIRLIPQTGNSRPQPRLKMAGSRNLTKFAKEVRTRTWKLPWPCHVAIPNCAQPTPFQVVTYGSKGSSKKSLECYFEFSMFLFII